MGAPKKKTATKKSPAASPAKETRGRSKSPVKKTETKSPAKKDTKQASPAKKGRGRSKSPRSKEAASSSDEASSRSRSSSPAKKKTSKSPAKKSTKATPPSSPVAMKRANTMATTAAEAEVFLAKNGVKKSKKDDGKRHLRSEDAPPKKAAKKDAEKPAKKESTAKSAAAPKKASKKKKSSSSEHPPYREMVSQALKSLTTTNRPASTIALNEYIMENFDGIPETSKRFIYRDLKAGEEEGIYKRHAVKTSSFYLVREKSEKSSKAKTDKKRTRSASPAKSEKSKRAKKQESESESSSEEEKPKKRSKKATNKAETAEKEETEEKPKKKPATKKAEPKKRTSKKAEEAETETSSMEVNIAGSKFDHYWQYKDNDGSYGLYDLAASDVLEGVYQGYLANRGDTDVRSVKSGQWEYMVDFSAMKQTNIQHENHTTRDIRRVPNKAKPISEE